MSFVRHYIIGKQYHSTDVSVAPNSLNHHETHNGNLGDSSSSDWADIPTDVSDALTDVEDDCSNEKTCVEVSFHVFAAYEK